MGKLIMLICILVLVGSVISAVPSNREEADNSSACKRQGDPCQVSEDCCPNLWCLTYAAKCVTKSGIKEPEVILCDSAGQCCQSMTCHAFAHKCQVIITAAELANQREKIFGRKEKNE